jgi:hypothetical protein
MMTTPPKITLNLLNTAMRLVGEDGKASAQFVQNFNNTLSTLLAAENSTAGVAQGVADLVDQLITLNGLITSVQTTQQTQLAMTNLATSHTSPAAVITTSSTGSVGTITIAAHSRVYADGTTVSVSGGSITGLGVPATYYIYYDDAARAGGSVTYQTTTNPSTASQTGNRHYVGDAAFGSTAGTGSGGGSGGAGPPYRPGTAIP